VWPEGGGARVGRACSPRVEADHVKNPRLEDLEAVNGKRARVTIPTQLLSVARSRVTRILCIIGSLSTTRIAIRS
jgi:hypothetical protein